MKKAIQLIIFLGYTTICFSQNLTIDEAISRSNEQIPDLLKTNFPRLTETINKEKKNDTYITKIYFGSFEGTNPIKISQKNGIIVFDKLFFERNDASYEALSIWFLFINIGVIHYMKDNSVASMTLEGHISKFYFAIGKAREIADGGYCRVLSIGLNMISNYARANSESITKQAALEVVKDNLFAQNRDFAKLKGCIISSSSIPENVNPVNSPVKNTPNENNLAKGLDANTGIKSNPPNVAVLSDDIITKNGKVIISKAAFKLLKEFDTVKSINNGTTEYTAKGLDANKKPLAYSYRIGYGIVNVPPTSSLYLTILRIPDGRFKIAMHVHYVIPNDATNIIEQVASYSFNWDSNLYTITNSNNKALKLGKFLNIKELEMFDALVKSKHIKIVMKGTNSVEEALIISKHDLKRMEDTLQLFKELTE